MGDMQTQYIVRFKGDYSALAKDMNKINVATKKLEDDEVIIKLNYDGNIKEFNKVFDKISKMHPELGIQFQYNVNEKILKQELDKLEKLSDLKLDIDDHKVQGKLEKLADNVDFALQEGMSKDEITKRVKEVFGYYNTAVKAGAKNVDFGSIKARLIDSFSIEREEIQDIWADVLDIDFIEPIELFKIDKSLNDDLLNAKDRVQDIKDTLKSLEEKGASKTGLPSELQEIQDEIKILRSDINDMQTQLKNLSGEAFDKMTESIKETNRQLSEAIDKIRILSMTGTSDFKVSSLKSLMTLFSEFARSQNNKNLSSFWDTLQTKIDNGDESLKTILTDLKLINTETGKIDIVNHGNVKSGGLTSDNNILLATKDATKQTDNTIKSKLEDTIILKQKLDEAADAGVNVSRILNIVYDKVSDTMFELQETAKGTMIGGFDEAPINTKAFEASEEQIQKLISDVLYLRKLGVGVDFHGLNILFDEIKGFSLIDLDLKPAKYDKNKTFVDDIVGGLTSSLEDANGNLDEASKSFINKVKTIAEKIDTTEMEKSATDATKAAADAIKKAQDSNSPAELTKPLGKDFGAGYAEGIREAMPDIVEACRDIVLAARNAIEEALNSGDADDTDISDKLTKVFDEKLPIIREKIKEALSNLNVDDENGSIFSEIENQITESLTTIIGNTGIEQNLTQTLENAIANAFSNVVLNATVRDLVKQLIDQIQNSMDSITSANPFRIKYFDVDSNSIVIGIQDALNNTSFKIDLSGVIQDLSTALNTSADNVRMSFVDVIKWMKEANELQKNNKEETHERKLYYNSKTGEFSNPSVIGDENRIVGDLSRALLRNELAKGKTFDTDLHWHNDWDTAAPSPQDLFYDFTNAYENGIEKFIVGAQNELTEIDFSKIAKDSQELAEKARNFLSNNIKSVEEALDEFIDRNGEDKGITYYDSANVDSIISGNDPDVRRLYGQYIKAILDNEWSKLEDEFIEKAQKAKYDDYTGNASFFDFTLLQQKKNKIGDDIGNLGLTDIFGESKYTKALSKEIPSSLDFSSFSNDFFISLMNNVKKGIDYTSFDGSIQSIREVVEETFEDAIDSDFSEILGNKFGNFKEFTIKYATEFIDNLFTDIQTELSKSERNEAYQQAGKQALKNISEKTLLKDAVNTYTHDEFEQKYGKNFKEQTPNNSSQTEIQPQLVDGFYTDLQEQINNSGKYKVSIWGDLVDNFKYSLQESIDELGVYNIEVAGQLIETFREKLCEAVDSFEPIPIEVKPYIRKGGEIEEVDLPGGDQNNLLLGDTADSDIGLTYDQLIEKIRLENEEVQKGNIAFKERITLLKNNKVVNSLLGDTSEIDTGVFSSNDFDKVIHTHEASTLSGGILSSEDYINMLQSNIKNIDLIWRDTISNFDFSQLNDDEFEELLSTLLEVNNAAKVLYSMNFFEDEEETINYIKQAISDLTSQSGGNITWADSFLGSDDKVSKLLEVSKRFQDMRNEFNYDKGYTYDDYLNENEIISSKLKKELSNQTPDSTSSTEAETKALLSKKEAVEQLRAELNLTKKAAEDVFNEQGYSKTNGKYQIEQQAIDELIASIKEKKQIEESEQPTTSPISTAMQEEVSAVNAAIEAEKKKFDELKNKISKSIPNAIDKKNDAFKKEAELVSSLVNGEVEDFDKLKQSVDSVTGSAKEGQKAVKDAKSNNKPNESNTETEEERRRASLLQQHYTGLRKDAYQSMGQKSQVQQDMPKYYSELEKESAKAYGNAESKANSLLKKVEKLRESGKYTQDFVTELNTAQAELDSFLKELEAGTIPFEKVGDKVKELSDKIENTLAKKAFNNVKQAAEKTLTNVGLKIDQIIAKNSAMGEDFESRFKALKNELKDAQSIDAVQKIVAEVNKLESELINAGKTGKSFFDQIKQRLRDINSKYIAQYFSFQDIIRYARQAATNVIELNDAFIELSKVSNTSLKSLEADFQSYASTAKDIGGTITDTINATSDWARMGMINAPLYGDI